jgi:hypothetical protein
VVGSTEVHEVLSRKSSTSGVLLLQEWLGVGSVLVGAVWCRLGVGLGRWVSAGCMVGLV